MVLIVSKDSDNGSWSKSNAIIFLSELCLVYGVRYLFAIVYGVRGYSKSKSNSPHYDDDLILIEWWECASKGSSNVSSSLRALKW
jgi:hypothetical protein